MTARKDDTGPFKSIFCHKAYQKFQNMIPYDNESKTNTFALHLYKKTKIENLADLLVSEMLSPLSSDPSHLNCIVFRARLGLSCIGLPTTLNDLLY